MSTLGQAAHPPSVKEEEEEEEEETRKKVVVYQLANSKGQIKNLGPLVPNIVISHLRDDIM